MPNNIRHIRIALLPIFILMWITTESISAQNRSLYSETVFSVTNGTTLYIGGDFIAGGHTMAKTCDMTIDASSKAILTGDFIHRATAGNVFTLGSAGTFSFEGIIHQNIKTDITDPALLPQLKLQNYINFPSKLIIKNNKHITMQPELAATTQDINLQNGWLILDSRNSTAADYGGVAPSYMSDRAVFAHLLVNGNINYQNWNDANINNRGFIQVNIPFDNKPMGETDNGYYNLPYRSLVGFGIPYKEVRADYFMFGFLMSPTNASFLGDQRATISDPSAALSAGRGYALGLDLRGTDAQYYKDISSKWIDISRLNDHFAGRATGNVALNRHNFSEDNTRKINQIFGTDVSQDAYQLEILNTADIPLTLNKKGFHYLANPYTTPLDINDLLESGNLSAWGMAEGDILKKVWILTGHSKGVAKYEGNKIKVIYNFYVAQNPGGTYTDDDGNTANDDDGMSATTTIGPLQMFVVKSKKDGVSVKIPAAKRVMGNTKFIKSAQARYDDFIFEVTDSKSGISDRTNIVIRPENEIASHPDWINVKKLSPEASNETNQSSGQSEGVLRQTLFSQLYTSDKDKTAFTVQFLPIESTPYIPLYMTPSNEAQEIIIRGIRLSSAKNVPAVYLEDKIEKKLIMMTPETRYTTFANPSDRVDRFILHFREVNEDDIIKKNSSIWANYQNGNLRVSGFDSKDFGSIISVYDMVGLQYIQTKVNNYTVNILCSLPTGVYILRVVGNRNEALKVAVGR